MRIGLVSGDGLPVSGLLTVFRSVFELGRDLGLVESRVTADLGYSWRPDKPGFFPSGPPGEYTPPWLEVDDVLGTADPLDAAELLWIRDEVARHDELTPAEHASLTERIEAAEALYRRGFEDWLARHRFDWVFALNMTLSDGVSVTRALHGAAAAHYASTPGGLLFWDHDLFRSYAVHDPVTGSRVYPTRPNRYTPVPQPDGCTEWAVISEPLAAETRTYPTSLVPHIVPNILPRVPAAPLEGRHHAFARRYELAAGRPIVLAPVRIFPVKGVDVALDFLAALKEEAVRGGRPVPYLLVFGSLSEDPPYAEQVLARTHRLGLEQDVRFLDGVPLASFADADGEQLLDEADLLRLAKATEGGVMFTPSVTDVETVGLGPGLAAAAGIPVAVTDYEVFHTIYGDSFVRTRVPLGGDDMRPAAAEFLDSLGGAQAHHRASLEHNRALTASAFPERPWIELWQHLADRLGGAGPDQV
ncbi:hypothetical protein ACFWBV_04325 [Streptomyces sp. NPDC060030]|uniref:hypothetical protein n=1 Tax=Streptomyces sp. NPDC060030 TaxID=3347042 RepID=UPI0036B35026